MAKLADADEKPAKLQNGHDFGLCECATFEKEKKNEIAESSKKEKVSVIYFNLNYID